jgi:hypothetical protein
METVQSEKLVVLLGVAKLTIGIVVLNHFIACFWYGCASLEGGDANWVYQSKLGDNSTLYLYWTSLHWSLSQFTPASMEVYPSNVFERVFTVFVILFALVAFSSFVSSITNAMTTLRNMNSEQAKNMSLLQRYLRSNQISISLCVRIRRHVDFKFKMQRQTVQEKDVSLLQMLSAPMRHDLHYELYCAPLKSHGFFAHFDTSFKRAVKKICSEAVESLHVSEGDVFFCRGDEAKSFFILKNGLVKYKDCKEVTHHVDEGMWLAEAILWAPWVHHGQAKAQTESLLLFLQSARFQKCMQENRAALGSPSHYARLFVEHMNGVKFEDLTDLRDETFEMDWAVDVAFAQLARPDSIDEEEYEESSSSDNESDPPVQGRRSGSHSFGHTSSLHSFGTSLSNMLRKPSK